jgi:hypothetical protein|tara:strand:- start:1027 stop:2763 length:1737 start_codon:yes stop_codon:yes gene_type:complete
MKRSSHLNKLKNFIFLIFILIFNQNLCFAAVDIWEKKEKNKQEGSQSENENNITIEDPIFSDDTNKVKISIEEKEIDNYEKSIIGIFDPAENNFNLNMWSETDGEEIKKILKRIDKLKLSKPSEDLLFLVLFTNAYPPKANLSSEGFLNIKINWLIKKKRIYDLETLLKNNLEANQNPKAIKFLINEQLSTGDIKSACEKINFIDKSVQDSYLDKFTIYCLINNNLKDEAQLILDLLKEKGFKDKFFEDKVSFLLGITDKTTDNILDNNLLNFYLSHITSENFQYEPNDKTDKYIWRYLSSANLIKFDELESENTLPTYEKAASENSFANNEIFKIYLKMNFNFSQLANVEETYKNLSTSKARALVYQSVILSDKNEKKIRLAFLLKDLFLKDNIFDVYAEELSNILKSIDPNEIPEDYVELLKKSVDNEVATKVKFDNDILHRSKVIRHFLDNNKELSRTEKDFKSVYKKIKKNKKYFISIKDIVVLESLVADGVSLPENLNYSSLSSQLTIPKNLEDLANQNQLGLVMLKIVEIIGEDNIRDLDPETVYFLNSILNQLNLKKIRNNILSEALPTKI